MKTRRDEGEGRTLLGDNTGGGSAVMMWPIRFHCAGVGISTGPPSIHMYSWPYVYIRFRFAPDLPESKYSPRCRLSLHQHLWTVRFCSHRFKILQDCVLL